MRPLIYDIIPKHILDKLFYKKDMESNSLTVCVTGAAGQIAYAFLPQLCKGLVFPGADIHLRLLDIPPAVKVMKGVALELEDCSFPTLKSVKMS